MLWVIFAFLSPLLWSMNSVLNKIMLSKIIKNPFSYFVLSNIIHTPIVFLVAFLFFNPVFDFNFFVLSLISSIFGSAAFISFLFALQNDDASKVVPLSNLGVIFILILSFFFLNESFTPSKYFGIALILVGAAILSYKKTKGKFHFSPAMIFIILSAAFFSVSTVLDKYILEHLDFWSRYVWGTIGGNILAYILFLKKDIKKGFFEATAIKRKYFLAVEANNLLGMGGLISLYLALTLGTATLVSAIGAIGPLMTLLITTALSLFVPHILEEEINRRNMAIKLFSIAVIIVGTIIIVF